LGFSLGRTLRTIMPCLSTPSGIADDVSESLKEQWVELLQRPDVAKFTIALAFRNALQTDGIHFQFCEAKLNDIRAV